MSEIAKALEDVAQKAEQGLAKDFSTAYHGILKDTEQKATQVAEHVAENEAKTAAELAGKDAVKAGEGGLHEPHFGGEGTGLGGGGEHVPGAGREQVASPREAARPEEAVCPGGEPVDMATGRMFIDQVDASLPGALPLVFTRCFESGYGAGRWMGRRWVCSFDERLEIDDLGVVHLAADRRAQAYDHPEPGAPVEPSAGPRRELGVDARGRFYTLTDRSTGLVREFTVRPEGREALLTGVRDRFGHTIEFRYSPDGTPTDIVHSGGYRLLVTVEDDRITALRLADPSADGGETVLLRYGYTGGNLTEVYNSSGLPMRFAYDTEDRVVSWTDRNGSHYAYTYDQFNRVVEEGGADGAMRFTFTYGEADPATGLRVHTETDALGHTTTYHVNEHAQITARIDPLGHITHYERDAYDNLLAETDPLGRTTRYEYDASGDLIAVTRPDGERATAAYAGQLSLPTEITEPGGATWRQTYDDAGRRTCLTDPLGATTSFAYDDAGHLAAVTDALGHTTRVRCDPAGLAIEVTDPTGATTRCERDAFGRVIALTDPLGNTTHLTWTVDGYPASRTAPDGSRETWTYDGEGNMVAHTDQLGQVTRFEYTHFETLAARTDPDGARIAFTHDANMRLVGVTNPLGQQWRYTYDPAGRLTAETDFNGRTIGYDLDSAGQVTAVTNPLGQQTHYTYDTLGRVTTKNADGRLTTYTYNPAGHLTRATNPDADVTCDFDALGNLLAETTNGRVLTFERDELGRRIRRVTPRGHVTASAYDPAGRPVTVSTPVGALDFCYDAGGRETVRTIGDSLRLESLWDPQRRLIAQTVTSRQSQAALQSRAYRYRADGNLTAIGDQMGGQRDLALDSRGRVTSVQAATWSERYVYDPAGNLLNAEWPATSATEVAVGQRSYDGTDVITAGRVRYEHDAAGRIVLRQATRLSRKPDTWSYTWDAENHLVEVLTPDGSRWRYLYDPFGRRIAKLRMGADGATAVERTEFTWDGLILAEQTTHAPYLPGPHVLTWDHKGLRPIAQTESVLTQERVDQRFFAIVTDLVGTPTELVDPSTETIAWRSVATLWGQTSWPRDSTTYTPLRFPGQYFDPETRLHYNVHRFYDPETARYFSQDPLGLLPAPNPAAYVRNPCTWVDPFGLSPHPRGPLYSEIQHGQRGPAYAEVTPQTLADAQAGIIGSEPGRGARWAPDGFVANSGHSRGHLIGRQFGGDGRDMRNIITQGATQNNGPISDAEGIIANHVASTGNPVIMSVTPIYGNGGVLATQVRLEAVDDFGWSFDQTLANF